MTRYIIRRLIQGIPTLFGITLLSFLIITAAPGGPTAALAMDPRMTPAKRAIVSAQLGIDDPWPVQYLRWLIGDDWYKNRNGEYGTRKGILRLDFGYSFIARRSVWSMITERAGATLELTSISLLIGVVSGVVLGVLAAVNRGGGFDTATRILAVILNAVPHFWLGLILIMTFGAQLHLLPMGGRCDERYPCPPLNERLEYLILPTLILATGGIAGYSRYMRASMLEVISQDYIRTARAKGLQPWRVWFIHAARNALIPLATFLGPAVTSLLSGAVITETIFSWPGLGRLGLTALNTLDYPLIMGLTVLGAVATILGFILSDILYALIDPRIRFV